MRKDSACPRTGQRIRLLQWVCFLHLLPLPQRHVHHLEGGSMTDHNKRDKATDANRDPITKEPGAHPLGTGAGAASGAAAGAAIGTAVGGPVGTLIGGAAGAVAGGLAGKGAAEAVNPTREDEYW